MSEPFRIDQKTRSERTTFVFKDTFLEYKIKDSSGTELALQVPYLSLPDEADYRQWTQRRHDIQFITYLVLLIGLFQSVKHSTNMLVVVEVVAIIWLLGVSVALLIEPLIIRKYISVPALGHGSPIILNDKQRARVLQEIKERRYNAFRETYARLDPNSGLQQEFSKFLYLRDIKIITTAEFDVFMQRLGLDDATIATLGKPEVATKADVVIWQRSILSYDREFRFLPERLYFRSKYESFSVPYAHIAPEQDHQRLATPSTYAMVPFALALAASMGPFYFFIPQSQWMGTPGFYNFLTMVAVVVPTLWIVNWLTRKYMNRRKIIVPTAVAKLTLLDDKNAAAILAEIAARRPVYEAHSEDAHTQAVAVQIAQIRQLLDAGVLDEEEAERLMHRAQNMPDDNADSLIAAASRKMH